MPYIDTKYLFKCETCRNFRNDVCRTFCESGESYSPSISKIPAADVAPRAEAVREVFKAFGVLIPENTTLEEAVESYKKTQKIIRNMAIANAKAEVAREIFAELESKIKNDMDDIAESINSITDPDAIDGQYEEIATLEWVLDYIAELKEKYTDATDTNVGHKTKKNKKDAVTDVPIQLSIFDKEDNQ